jgi:PAS domain S-box-containing protein
MKAMENPHLRVLFSQSPLPIWLLDADSQQLVDINDAMLRSIGYSRADFFALSPEEMECLVCMSNSEEGDDVWAELRNHHTVTHIVRFRIRGDQEVRFNVTCTLVEDPSGQCLVWCQAERLLSNLSERFSNWFEDLGTNIFFYRHTVDDGRLMDLSDSFEVILGISRKEALGQSWISLIAWKPETLAEAAKRISALRPGMSDQMDMEFIHRNGQERTLKVVAHMFVDEQGRVCIDGAAEDITTRKEMEMALRQANEEADRANQAKSTFLAQMSHELRTPLNAIMSFSQLLELENLAPGHRSLLGDIRYSSEHLLQLINDLLDLARIESGRVDLDIVSVDVAGQIRDVMRILLPIAESKGVELLDVEYVNSWVRADKRRLQQVLLNLLSNAVKYNKNKGRVEVLIEQRDEEWLRIAVCDTGQGISSELQDRLFQPFERIGAEDSSIEGTGLGLTITKQLVELMGGEIGVDSTLGEGSTFWFDLPTAAVDEVSQTEADVIATPETIVPKCDARVVYIEDNKINAKIVEHIFRRYFSIEVETALSAMEGLKLIRAERPELILLDVDLPDMNGYDVIKEIMAEEGLKDVPVIALTGNADLQDRQRGIRAGFSEYLTKPLDIERLVEVVSPFLTAR